MKGAFAGGLLEYWRRNGMNSELFYSDFEGNVKCRARTIRWGKVKVKVRVDAQEKDILLNLVCLWCTEEHTLDQLSRVSMSAIHSEPRTVTGDLLYRASLMKVNSLYYIRRSFL